MRLLPRLLAALALLLLAACSSAGSPTAAPGGTTPSGSATGSAPASGAGSSGPPVPDMSPACPYGGQTGRVMLAETDNHKSVCLTRGTTLEIYLHARDGSQWSKPTPESAILQPTATGRGALQIGVTAGFFTAAQAGQTRVTAQLVPCRGPKPGPMCDVVELFEVNVTVR
jgi:hypothetical protein